MGHTWANVPQELFLILSKCNNLLFNSVLYVAQTTLQNKGLEVCCTLCPVHRFRGPVVNKEWTHEKIRNLWPLAIISMFLIETLP